MDRALRERRADGLFNTQLLLLSEKLLQWCPARRPAAKDFRHLAETPGGHSGTRAEEDESLRGAGKGRLPGGKGRSVPRTLPMHSKAVENLTLTSPSGNFSRASGKAQVGKVDPQVQGADKTSHSAEVVLCTCVGQCGSPSCLKNLNRNRRKDDGMLVDICSREAMLGSPYAPFCTFCRCEAVDTESGESCLPLHKIGSVKI